MVQNQTKTKRALGLRLVYFLEKELFSVLALILVLVFAIYSRASTATISMSVSIYDPTATITVISPNGGETWYINDPKEITWDSTGDIPNVKIELTRNGSTYETIVASTTNDGTHPWTVTSPATSSAKIKISDVLNLDNYDESNTTFTIAERTVPPPPGGGGGGGTVYPLPPVEEVEPEVPLEGDKEIISIISVQPREFYGSLGTYLTVRGIFTGQAKLRLSKNGATSPVLALAPKTITLESNGERSLSIEIKPNVLSAGDYDLLVEDGEKKVTSEKLIKVISGTLSSRWIRQSDYPTVSPGEEFEMWVEFRNTGTIPWLRHVPASVRLGTSRPRDRGSRFGHFSWINKNRLTLIGQDTQPGGVGRFTFRMKAPLRSGIYREYVEPVAEFSQWISPDWGVYWDIRVESKQVSLREVIARTVKKLIPAPTPAKTEVAPQPQSQPTNFVTRLLNAFLNLLSRGFAGSGVKTGD